MSVGGQFAQHTSHSGTVVTRGSLEEVTVRFYSPAGSPDKCVSFSFFMMWSRLHETDPTPHSVETEFPAAHIMLFDICGVPRQRNTHKHKVSLCET